MYVLHILLIIMKLYLLFWVVHVANNISLEGLDKKKSN